MCEICSYEDLKKANHTLSESYHKSQGRVRELEGWLNKYRAWFDGTGNISDLWEDPYMKEKNKVEELKKEGGV